jgi:hypothetical protein
VHDGRIMEPPDALPSFRRSLYECFRRRSDALFELTDAILAADSAVPSPAHLRAYRRRIVAAGAAFMPPWTEDGSTPSLYGGFSPAIRLLRAKRPSTP